MIDDLITILSGFNYPVYKQGSCDDAVYQDESFFTFWNNTSPDHAHYDNLSYGTAWDYNIFFYSVDPALPYTVMNGVIDNLKAAGWIVDGKGYDTVSDTKTHTGRGLHIQYLEF